MRYCTLVLFLLVPAPAWPQPAVAANGIVNSADYTRDIAPGSILAIFGTNLASATLTASSVPLPASLDGVSVEVLDGTRTLTAPLYFVSAGQINAQLPWDLQSATVQVRVKTKAGTSLAQSVPVKPRAPKLFTKTSDGKGEAIVLHPDYKLVGKDSPARPGEVVIVCLTGLGAVSPAIPAGAPGGDNGAVGPLNLVNEEVTASINGAPARVWFAGLAPYMAGVYQLNVQVPAGASAGMIAITISTAANASQAGVTLSCQPAWPQVAAGPVPAAGGSLNAAGVGISVPAGSFPNGSYITLSRPDAGAALPGGRFRASDVFAVDGIPNQLQGPVTISVDLTSVAFPQGDTLLAVRVAGDPDAGVQLLDGTVSGNRLTATIPPPVDSAAAPGSLKRERSASGDDGIWRRFEIWAVCGYYRTVSKNGRFSIRFPAADLIDGGADVLGDALEEAYTKLGALGLDWGRRPAKYWPMNIRIDPFTGDDKEKWAQEDSAWWGQNRQGISFNANFMKTNDQMATMRVAAGHELFHILQNLYDPRNRGQRASGPGPWYWMNEAMSTWFERLLAADPAYVPGTVKPDPTNPDPSQRSNNYEFLVKHGLEYPPGDLKAVQNHGYGASMFLQYLSRKNGDQVIGQILKLKEPAAAGAFAASLYSPVEAADRVTGSIGLDWLRFCENYMAGTLWQAHFPTVDEVMALPATGSGYTFADASRDKGVTWSWDAPDLSAHVYTVAIDAAQLRWGTGTKLTVALSKGSALAEAIIYRRKRSGSASLLTFDRVVQTSYSYTNAEQLIANGEHLVIMVANGNANRPYAGTAPITLTVTTEASVLDTLVAMKTLGEAAKPPDGRGDLQ